MSVSQPVASDHQLARLLQIGMVLEEVVEARAHQHYRSVSADLDTEIEALLEHAAEESADHRDRLAALIDDLDAERIAFEQIEPLVADHYDRDRDTDGVLYDQLCNEETAYKFYDDLIAAIEASSATFGIDREHLVETLSAIREEEADGAEEVTRLMEARE
ncbi:ferritin-like domain-containing protein [Halococcus qingdaonensis]|uniref:ferritin-like domain-containing protein n=1 Tax=Halococcus qingdaonensis TaxID=224402 RepID=UPI002116767C|nr:ferritin-like domain-containing protein [Halococcus qingdaonensis]